ncbi:hypothetical protein J31TS4_42610 [Paenibacillus sp. J31TS4]|uniref:TIGR03826 family flagellar region protein n=1 Tax=Paenibacillus sp. J31TS4 TaxID=2807195 RepID=UPI001B1229A5|nr:TIGR03826 family flagellar region protein [Paenibacillus sp. J31TS4]GIP40981.1 hypothetical protein J31TS4_42610 [Paenibacillus sp. J31TS4]
MNVDNCPRCGKLYVKGFQDVCPACVKDIERMYEACIDYLRENRQSTLQELHEETEVPIRQILKFIREGRISLKSLPNLTIPCDVCGAPIREGSMCDSCRQRLTNDLKQSLEARGGRQSQEDQFGYNIQDRLRRRNN